MDTDVIASYYPEQKILYATEVTEDTEEGL
jgi:hypothetical protein